MSKENTGKNRATQLWFWVVIAFLILIAAWTALIKVANDHPVEIVPLESNQP